MSLIFLSFRAQAANTYWPQTAWHSFATKMALMTHKYDQALQHSLKALEADPMQPELHINLGNSLEGLGAVQKAIDAYGVAGKISEDPSIQFQVEFNQAQALAKVKKVDEALVHYQKALDFIPDSREVKTNIELLMSSSGGKGGKDKDKDQDQKEGDGEGDQQKEPQKFAENKPQDKKQPQNLSQADVKKILEELKQQEQRIRGEYYKQGQREQKQKPGEGKREKDW
jgi:tetratricopeptide (TPR) repeat protein